MDNSAIELKKVTKNYELRNFRGGIREYLPGRNRIEMKTVLEDITITIPKGETVGLIGANGSGKSTLLKLIAGITRPTSGRVVVSGEVGALIELGVGFVPDLTGRENLYLNAAVLGISRHTLKEELEEIISFSGIADYIDQPTRTYSSGMLVRLGFSLAIRLEPEILLIDEVLAVGDESFQHRSIDAILALHEAGKTIVFVSHNMALVDSFCDRVIWLNQGKVAGDGLPSQVIPHYLISQQEAGESLPMTNTTKNKKIVLSDVEIVNKDDSKTQTFFSSEPIKMRFSYAASEDVVKPMFSVAFFHRHTYLFGSKFQLDRSLQKNDRGVLTFELPNGGFTGGVYAISLGVCSNNQWENPYDYYDKSFTFTVVDSATTLQNDGLVDLKNSWVETRT